MTSKKVAPKRRWNESSTSATVMTGMANTSRNCTTRTIQVKTGIFMSVMPGARMFRTVTMRLMELVSEASPVMSRAMAQKSMPWLGEKTGPVLGA